MTDYSAEAVNVPERLALRGDGTLGDITTLIDDEGDLTDDPESAVVATVKWRDAEVYVNVVLSDYTREKNS